MIYRLVIILLYSLIPAFGICQAFPSFTGEGTDKGATPFLKDANGRPLHWGSTYVADGSPYYYDEYIWADITVSSGKIYKDVRVKFNLIDHQLQYLADDGTEMIATTAVKSIRFTSFPVTRDSVKTITLISNNGVLNQPEVSIYEVLDSGKSSLLKKISVSYRDEKKYGEAVTTRHFERKENEFFILLNNEYKKVEKKNEFFLTLLHDRSKEIEDFINKNRLNCRSIKDIQQLIRYYNSLF
jgi:hypothetical protein